jgi:alginate O-acetyltransferase complex protein AlgI
MMLSEVEFVFFFPAVVLLHWLLPRKASWQNAFLLLASYLFYLTWNAKLIPLLLLATLVDYGVGRYLGAHPPADDLPPAEARRRRLALAASLAWNLGTLAFFKYAGFFADSFNQLMTSMGLPSSLPVLRLILPLGLSYYTLQKLGYIIDVYYGRQEPCRSLLTFALFTAFFPQMIAGPISRASALLPQLQAPRSLDPDRVRSAALTFLVGFTGKAYIADFLGRTVVDPVFRNPDAFSVAGHWVGLVGYALQVFCDFGGYSFMALAAARFLGIELPVNFTTPFLASSLFDFWRRWHITLNTWLFEYIYTPLSTSRGFFYGRLDAALLVTFLASGIWHGATGTFVLWGVMQGLGLVAARRWDEFYRGLCRRDRSWVAVRKSGRYEAGAWALTQGFFLLSLVLFRAPSLGGALAYARGLVVSAGTQLPNLMTFKNAFNLAACLALFVAYHVFASGSGRPLRDRFLALPAPVRGMAYGLALVFLSLLMPTGAGAFIYGQF